MPHARSTARFSFLRKIAVACALVALADVLFVADTPANGAVLGIFAVGMVLALGVTRPIGWPHAGRIAVLLAALVYAFALIEDPSLLALGLFWVAISLATLLPRIAFRDALAWGPRLVVHALAGPFAPLADCVRLFQTRRRPGRANLPALAGAAALPVIGGLVFAGLFASANPIIDDLLSGASAPGAGRCIFWICMAIAVWPTLRPPRITSQIIAGNAPIFGAGPAIGLASVLSGLVTFNLLFAVQNGLDIAFLWSGAPLPGTITMADYAHRGAYALIATALLAGGLALWMLRPGSPVAAHPWARRLLILWIGQNLLLVASSMLRTLDYVDAYSLTRLRIAALAWMVLVAIGLLSICWRILRAKSAAWLINVNMGAVAIFLTIACFVDLGSAAARWNIRHAREAGGAGQAIDLCYLGQLGDSALLPLIAFEKLPHLDPALRDRVTYLRLREMEWLRVRMNNPRGWTWRGARRLASAEQATAGLAVRTWDAPNGRGCDGSIMPPPKPWPLSSPPEPAEIAQPPLTPKAKQ